MEQTLADVLGDISASVARSSAVESTHRIDQIRALAEQPDIESGIKGVSVPAISALAPEYMAPESIDIQFDLAVRTGYRLAKQKAAGATLDGEVKGGLLGIGQARGEILATLRNDSNTARSTDTRATMRVRMKYTKAPLPDGIRMMVDAANKIAHIRNQAVIAQHQEQPFRT